VAHTYDFGEEFQHKLLGLIFAGALGPPVVIPRYFQNPIHAELCAAIIQLRQAYSDLTPAMLEEHLLGKRFFKDRDYREELLDILPRIRQPLKKAERAYLFDLAYKFARLEQYREFFRKGVDLLQDGNEETLANLDALFADLALVSANGDGAGEMGYFYFSSLAERLKERDRYPEVLRPFIPNLEKCLANQGFAKEELVVFAGLASSGKSFALLHMANMALVQKKKVVFYSLEMTEEKLATRLDAAYTGFPTSEIRANNDAVQARLMQIQKMFGDNILFKKMKAGFTRLSDLRAHLDLLKFKGFTPEVLILDYINLMRPETPTREGRHRDLGDVYIGLKGLQQERHLWAFTAAQSNRAGFNSPLITIKDFADSFEGGMHADVVISINRNDDEAEQEKVRLYVAKDRDGVDKKTIVISTNYAKGAFFSRKHSRDAL
jgi:hypothetical protein